MPAAQSRGQRRAARPTRSPAAASPTASEGHARLADLLGPKPEPVLLGLVNSCNGEAAGAVGIPLRDAHLHHSPVQVGATDGSVVPSSAASKISIASAGQGVAHVGCYTATRIWRRGQCPATTPRPASATRGRTHKGDEWLIDALAKAAWAGWRFSSTPSAAEALDLEGRGWGRCRSRPGAPSCPGGGSRTDGRSGSSCWIAAALRPSLIRGP